MQTQERIINPYAPPAYNGLLSAAPDGYTDMVFYVPFDIFIPAAGPRRLSNLGRDVPTDADFIWRTTIANFRTGNYRVQFADSQGYRFSDALIHVANLSASAISPGVNGKEIVIPAGGQIGIDIEDLTGADNTIQIVFQGVKRYKVSTSAPAGLRNAA